MQLAIWQPDGSHYPGRVRARDVRLCSLPGGPPELFLAIYCSMQAAALPWPAEERLHRGGTAL